MPHFLKLFTTHPYKSQKIDKTCFFFKLLVILPICKLALKCLMFYCSADFYSRRTIKWDLFAFLC